MGCLPQKHALLDSLENAKMSKPTPNDLQIYDDFADAWWDGSTRWIRTLANMVPARLRYFEQHVPGWDGLDVLDVGCAGGFLTEELSRKGAKVSGIDPADRAIAAAQAHAESEGLNIDYRVGTGESLPWPDRSFDAVTCVDVLEHVSSVDKVISEVVRVLRPGGWFLFDTISRNPLASFLVVTMAERVLGLLPRGAHDPDLFIRPAELKGKLVPHNFAVRPFRGLGPTGVNCRGDLTFGVLPFKLVIYLGAARLER
jgi:2-polyprenyl-6-hydroxyphenyl methylase/3-demethylubiquinone-9 3-methyltransferase